MLLFLDYDGVLHPDAVYLMGGRNRRLELRAEGSLFMWAPILANLLEPYPGVRIVLATSWVKELGFHRARACLPPTLGSRVIGGTWHSKMGRHPEGSHRIAHHWHELTRFQQIAQYLRTTNGTTSWLAIDDDSSGWDPAFMERLVATEGDVGLSSRVAQECLLDKLRRFGDDPFNEHVEPSR